MRDVSLGSARALQLNWAGIDIVKSKADNKYYVLEANRRPGLTLESSEVRAAYTHILSLLAERGLYLES